MDGIEDIIVRLMGADETITDGGDIDVGNILSESFGSSDFTSIENFGESLNDEMNQALNEFTNNFMSSSETEAPSFIDSSNENQYDAGLADNGGDISFLGSGDKYSDNEYNRKAADKWLEKEKECLEKGDVSGAAAAHSEAKKHLNRIK